MRNKLLYVLTDGGRARLVAVSAETGDFATLEELDNGEALRRLRRTQRASPAARTENSQGDRRHKVGPDDSIRREKEAFIARVAERALDLVRRRGFEGVSVAAPKRLVGVLRGQLEVTARVVETVGKDLTKTPNHDLGDWFSRLPRLAPSQEARP